MKISIGYPPDKATISNLQHIAGIVKHKLMKNTKAQAYPGCELN